jgi:hypothetical protein
MGRHEVDAHERFTILPIANQVKSVVNSGKYPVLLGSPCGSPDTIWELRAAGAQRRCLDLSEKPAKLADDVGTLEIYGQLLELTDTIASRA